MATLRTHAHLNLQQLLGDLPESTFASDWLGSRFLALPGEQERFRDLFSWQDLNSILETNCFTRSTIRLKKGGADVPFEVFLKEFAAHNKPIILTEVSALAVTREMRDGATLIVNEIQRFVPTIGEFARQLEMSLQARVNINMYAVLHEKHGFNRHYDTHDVLVLQISGRKRWQIFGKRQITPLPTEPFDPSETPQSAEPVWDEALSEGDALYVPRGFWHFVQPLGEPTIHLSVGIVRPTGHDVVQWAIRKALTDQEILRQNMPWSDGADDGADYRRKLAATVSDILAEPASLQSARIDEALNYSSARRGQRIGLPWAAMPQLLPADRQSAIRLVGPYSLKTYADPGTDKIALYFNGKPVATFRKPVAALCDYLEKESPTTLERFYNAHAAQWPEATLSEFLQELVLKGLIVVSEPGQRSSQTQGESALANQ